MYQRYIVMMIVQRADYTNESKYLMWRVEGNFLQNLSYLNITVIYGGLPLFHSTNSGGADRINRSENIQRDIGNGRGSLQIN